VSATAETAEPAEPATGQPPGPPAWLSSAMHRMVEANVAVVTALALLCGLIVGAVLIIVTTPATLHAWGNIASNPGHAFGESYRTVG
jgi:hypothetical protein